MPASRAQTVATPDPGRITAMPVIKCIDCGMGRRYQRPPAEPRCIPCARIRAIQYKRDLRADRKRRNLCTQCGEPLSRHSRYCAGCAERSAVMMREKRSASPMYRKNEREKVRLRMQAIRAERRKAGITGNGTPYKSQATADREGIRTI
jgi:hypothetical protein